MEYVIILLLIIVVILQILCLLKNINEANITERLSKLEINMIKELDDFKDGLNDSMSIKFDKLNDTTEKRLIMINEKVNERLDQNFEKTNKTFTSVLERLSKIDEAQKKIELLSNDIVSLQSILTDKKTRGIFGEINLKQILVSVFGENTTSIYKLQAPMSNGTIADCILYAPKPLGTIAIDSKFPLEHYQIMMDKKISNIERENAAKLFKLDMKKHIDAISSKYIIQGETTDSAILFLPAEAIFAEVNAYHQDIINYAYKKHVWITSPTTLISTLTVVQMILKNIERDKYSSIIHEELNKLGVEFSRYRERWDKLSKSIYATQKDAEALSITTDKITKKFENISQVKLGNNSNNKENKEIEYNNI